MEIMKELKWSREGNDCWVTDYCAILRIDTGVYVVLHTDVVQGSWTGDPITTKTAEFRNYDDALLCMKSICSNWKVS